MLNQPNGFFHDRLFTCQTDHFIGFLSLHFPLTTEENLIDHLVKIHLGFETYKVSYANALY